MLVAVAVSVIGLYRRRLAMMRDREAERLYRPIEMALKESENPTELQTRVQTILSNQKRYTQSVTKTQQADKQQIERSSHSFMDRVMSTMELNYSDPEFGVEQTLPSPGHEPLHGESKTQRRDGGVHDTVYP